MSFQHTTGDGWVPEDMMAGYEEAKELLALKAYARTLLEDLKK